MCGHAVGPARDTGAVELTWVDSRGGPLIVVPTAVLPEWAGGSPDYDVTAGDYGRACAVDDLAGVIAVGGATAIVLGDEPASTCWLPEHMAFLRWIAAESEAAIRGAASTVLVDPETVWEDAGTWETPGPAVLIDSTLEGAELSGIDGLYVEGAALLCAPVPICAGRWQVRACYAEPDGETSLVLVRLTQA